MISVEQEGMVITMSVVALTIDGKHIAADSKQTILEAALDNGIYIPHLCSHENLLPAGACRMCAVGVQGCDGIVTACSTRVYNNMVVDTHDMLAEKIRRLSCDFICRTHPADCTGCPKYGKCQLQTIIQYVGDTGRKLRDNKIISVKNESNPIILHEMTRCILCGRCVRACADMRGVGAIKFGEVKGRAQIVIDGQSLNSAGCRYCAACVDVCPTGSIREHEEIAEKHIGKTREQSIVPCLEECPAHIDIPRYVRHIRNGEYATGIAFIREKVPFPHVLGFICDHPCESECKRAYINEPVNIRDLKRYTAQHDNGEWKAMTKKAAQTGKRVAVIGAGPAGLTCAYLLARKGHGVTVFDENNKPGGMLRYGVPKHRLPRIILDKEIDTILDIGVTLQTGSRIDKAPALLEQGFDAVFVAVGTHSGIKLPIPGSELSGVHIGTVFLHYIEQDEAPTIGKNVMILGGGNVALDCAAVAKRLGAETVHVACLESYENMTASDEEKTLTAQEGTIIYNERTFLEIIGDNGAVAGMKLASVSKFSFDENGKSQVELVPDSEEIISADSVIFAIGQHPGIDGEFGLELTRGRRINTTNACETSVRGVYAAGDSVTGTSSVIKAIAGARAAALNIDIFLGGDGVIDEELAPNPKRDPRIGSVKSFGDMPRNSSRIFPPEVRCTSFEQMDTGFDEQTSACEAGRCLQCDLRLDIAPQKFWTDYPDGAGGTVS